MSRQRTTLWVVALIVAVAAAWWLVTLATDSSSTPTTPGTSPATVTTAPVDGEVDPASGLRWIATSALPPEAHETLELIASGGPFPFDRDGTVFMNREETLPDEPRGYYREYTVVTPGSDDRGARRIVAGAGSERYYTDDHYESFRRIGP